MKAYLDASVVLRIVLRQRDPLPEWHTITEAVASGILQVECLRGIDRVQFTGELPEPHVAPTFSALHKAMDRIVLLKFTNTVLARAGQPLGAPLKTLDAIHLATAAIWRERTGRDIPFCTHDTTLANAARSAGFEVLGA